MQTLRRSRLARAQHAMKGLCRRVECSPTATATSGQGARKRGLQREPGDNRTHSASVARRNRVRTTLPARIDRPLGAPGSGPNSSSIENFKSVTGQIRIGFGTHAPRSDHYRRRSPLPRQQNAGTRVQRLLPTDEVDIRAAPTWSHSSERVRRSIRCHRWSKYASQPTRNIEHDREGKECVPCQIAETRRVYRKASCPHGSHEMAPSQRHVGFACA